MLYRQIADKLTQANASVSRGKMMSAPGIKYKNKVFAFYHQKEMVFKLGKDFDPNSFQLKEHSLLSPFKSKPPMAAWFRIPSSQHEKWDALAEFALARMAEELG